MLSLEQGKKVIEIARNSILENFWDKKLEVKEFSERKGVFVTLHSYPEKELRGCIGFPYAIMPLGQAIAEAAVSASSDPRFEPLSLRELDRTIIEISILTEPEEIKTSKEKLTEQISIGKDGLICKYGHFSGLLLPQVAVENEMDAKQFLDCVCNKAGLPAGAWKKPECKIYKFQAQIFSEKTPKGKIEEKK